MRGIELAEYFAHQYREISVVVYIREETAIVIAYRIPIKAVEIGVIKFVLDLFEHVVIDIRAFQRRLAIVGRVKLYGNCFAIGE